LLPLEFAFEVESRDNVPVADTDDIRRDLAALRAEFERLEAEHARLEQKPRDIPAHEAHRKELRELIERIRRLREEIARG
jgi:uncharacterized protein (UPF0335 family)